LNRSNEILELLAENDVFLAPMAGVTDRSFRILCKEMGCGLTYTEMVSAKGLHYGGSERRTVSLLSIDPLEAPAAVQLFGSDPDILAEQAAALSKRLGDFLALIDINMGCPAKKIVSNGEGSALMKDMGRARAVISAVAQAVDLPVTVKFRKGWDDASVNAVEFAVMAQDAGADAVTVHGRTRMQMYAPPVDLATIARVKEALDIPVIGNGDVFDIESAERMYEETKVDLVMVGRGAQGAPWVFRILKAWFERGVRLPEPCPEEKMDIMLRHIRLAVEYKGEYVAMREARKHVAWYCKGWRGAASLRRRAGMLTRYEELEELVRDALKDQRPEEEP